VVTAFGRMDVAVANAGFAVAGRIEKLGADDWRRQLDTNVVGLAITARHAIPHLRKTGGRLALVGSVASMLSTPNVGAYAASKFAVRAIGQALAAELHGSGVSCTTLHPGFVESEIGHVDNHGVYREDFEDRRPRRLFWSSERAARVMVRAIERRKREYVFTGHGKIGGFVGRHMPGLVHFFVTRGRADGYRRRPG
jgi:short-subunit dehydrogenase